MIVIVPWQIESWYNAEKKYEKSLKVIVPWQIESWYNGDR